MEVKFPQTVPDDNYNMTRVLDGPAHAPAMSAKPVLIGLYRAGTTP